MTRWFTADLHLGHANIIQYCDRPWPDADAMDRGLIERWNATVADDDEVWVLGDVAMGRIEESLRLIGELHGTKLLVPGNHDRCWPGRGDSAAEWVGRYRDAGFADVLPEIVELTSAGSRPARVTSRTGATATTTSASAPTARSTTAGCCCTATSTRGGASRATRSTSAATCGTTARCPKERSSAALAARRVTRDGAGDELQP